MDEARSIVIGLAVGALFLAWLDANKTGWKGKRRKRKLPPEVIVHPGEVVLPKESRPPRVSRWL